MKNRCLWWLIGVLAVFLLAEDVRACPTCFGDANSAQTEGIKWAIFSLLGITGTVLAGVAIFVLYLRRKALAFNRKFNQLLN